MLLYVAAPTLILATSLQSQQGAAPEKKVDTSSHTVGFVTVETGVKLEVLDWGGTGPALIFLAGSGFDAHSFDTFAPRFTRDHHVHGITRRGFGASSAPAPVEGTYSADRLADDVLAVMTDLKLVRPVLVGHSLAGEELSSIGTRFPEKISGLIYLDAGYSYAFYSPPLGDPVIDAIDLKRKLDLLVAGRFGALSDFEELQKDSDQFSRDLQVLIKQRSLMPAPPPRPANAPGPSPIGVALGAGRQKFGAFLCPSWQSMLTHTSKVAFTRMIRRRRQSFLRTIKPLPRRKPMPSRQRCRLPASSASPMRTTSSFVPTRQRLSGT